MTFHIITIFPDIFDSYLNESIIGRAIKNKLISIKFYNPRDFIKAPKNNYKPVDDKPYGGGPGMVMRAEPLLKTVAKVLNTVKGRNKKILIINFIPSAEKFTTTFAKTISKKYTDIILICGRYEGIDARVDKILRQAQDRFLKFQQLSVGDYVLTGGEVPAMILIDCVSRQIPGVLGKYESLEEERVSSSEVYTRPEVLEYPFNSVQGKKSKKYKVPKVLLSGNHKKIEDWKKKKL
ncbi:MAG: tRNA (guanine-N(1)-)-methyltransferase [Parcubacteria group bacterium GW2011_GWF2_38_8]|nr:MAG: tRNA (guanine-N(1)-)-methyltransferase [Parcubacteria group bacterium GW2011_GWF2_38_8]